MRDLDAIIAISQDGGIGLTTSSNGLPWTIKEDLAHFKRITQSRTMVMGRKTFQALPGILPGRDHVVVTSREPDFVHPRVRYVPDTELSGLDSPIVIGGPTLLWSLMPRLRTVYLTLIERDYKSANVRDKKLLDHLLQHSTHTVLGELENRPVTFLRLDMDEHI